MSYDTNVWPGGFTAAVTVRNAGPVPVDGWELTFTLPSGQRVTHAWNASVAPASGTVTARATADNARIAPGGSQSFGFQGAYGGTFARPGGFSLNGAPCTAA